MSPAFLLALAALFVVGAVLMGATPRGGKPVARTRLMATARLFLIVGVLVFGGLGLVALVQHR
jgi:hypothetical protein